MHTSQINASHIVSSSLVHNTSKIDRVHYKLCIFTAALRDAQTKQGQTTLLIKFSYIKHYILHYVMH